MPYNARKLGCDGERGLFSTQELCCVANEENNNQT